jgi:hypothetical protein
MLRIGEAQTVRQRYTPAQALLIRALARDVDIEVPDRITPYTAALYGSFTGIPFSTRAERLLFAPKLEVSNATCCHAFQPR